MTKNTKNAVHDWLNRALLALVMTTPLTVVLVLTVPWTAPIFGVATGAIMFPFFIWGIIYPDTRNN